jgi:C-terminal processing protease CtpA/Prc
MHHTQFDTFETAIDDYQRHSAIVQAVAAYQIANADTLLDRSNAFETHRRQIDARHDWAIIEEVPKGGKADRAGLRAGDVIVTVDGRQVFTSAAVRRYLSQDGPVKKLRIKRGKKTFDVTFDFTDDPGEVEEQQRKAARRAQIGDEVFERMRAEFAARQKRDGKPAECTDVIEAARARKNSRARAGGTQERHDR